MLKIVCDRCGREVYMKDPNLTGRAKIGYEEYDLCRYCILDIKRFINQGKADRKTENSSEIPNNWDEFFREPTAEERKAVADYIDSISVPTGVNIFDLMDEPQTDTEIAKAIVHKMIDDAVIAEDAYPDLRQKMHDAVDEYEPQTERSE